jgi:hypothetical protein
MRIDRNGCPIPYTVSHHDDGQKPVATGQSPFGGFRPFRSAVNRRSESFAYRRRPQHKSAVICQRRPLRRQYDDIDFFKSRCLGDIGVHSFCHGFADQSATSHLDHRQHRSSGSLCSRRRAFCAGLSEELEDDGDTPRDRRLWIRIPSDILVNKTCPRRRRLDQSRWGIGRSGDRPSLCEDTRKARIRRLNELFPSQKLHDARLPKSSHPRY